MATEPNKLAIVRTNLEIFGAWRTAGDVIAYLFSRPPRDRFDRKYGVATSGNVEKTDAGVVDEAALADAIRYVPISEQVMRHVLGSVTRVIDPATTTFVDFGCGKGRALVMAAWHPFQAIRGVELSPQHAARAQRNLAGYLAHPRGPGVRCRDVSVACANALHYELPATDLLVFMYRPFKGQVFQGVLDRLHAHAARTGRRILIAYVCPAERRMLERHPAFHQLADHQVISEEHRWSLWECRPDAAAADAS
jgi:SAM-dependent methyltransferase